jgi:hypothetical protein
MFGGTITRRSGGLITEWLSHSMPEVDGGLFEPHFARFQKIVIGTNFDLKHTQNTKL